MSSEPIETLRERWLIVRAETVTYLKVLPDRALQMRAAPEMRNVEEMVRHILAAEKSVLEAIDSGEFEWRANESSMEQKSWDQLIEQAESLAQRLATLSDHEPAWLDQSPPGSSLRRSEWLWQTLGHEIHHRAQISVTLRLGGIEPPQLYA